LLAIEAVWRKPEEVNPIARGRGVYVAGERHEEERQAKNNVSAVGGNGSGRPGS